MNQRRLFYQAKTKSKNKMSDNYDSHPCHSIVYVAVFEETLESLV